MMEKTIEISNNPLEQITSDILTLKNKVVGNMIQLGQKLIEAKELVPHGEWAKWLETKVEFSQRTANNLMRIAREFSTNSQLIANLEPTKVYTLLELSVDDREKFLDRYDLKNMTVREMKSNIEEFKRQNSGVSVIDYVHDYETYEIPVNELKPLPDHEKYFGNRVGAEWLWFLDGINKCGVICNITIARDNTIIDGHERVRAYRDLGIPKIPCSYACQEKELREGCSDDELKVYLHLFHNMQFRGTDGDRSIFLLKKLFNGKYGKCGNMIGDINDYPLEKQPLSLLAQYLTTLS